MACARCVVVLLSTVGGVSACAARDGICLMTNASQLYACAWQSCVYAKLCTRQWPPATSALMSNFMVCFI